MLEVLVDYLNSALGGDRTPAMKEAVDKVFLTVFVDKAKAKL
jgi:hypothetical protein